MEEKFFHFHEPVKISYFIESFIRFLLSDCHQVVKFRFALFFPQNRITYLYKMRILGQEIRYILDQCKFQEPFNHTIYYSIHPTAGNSLCDVTFEKRCMLEGVWSLATFQFCGLHLKGYGVRNFCEKREGKSTIFQSRWST